MHFPLLQVCIFKVLTFDRVWRCIFVPCMLVLAISIAQPSAAQSWLLNGNSGTSPMTNFVGTKDSTPLVLRTNNVERIRVLTNGRVGIGTTTPFALLNVKANGNVSLGTTDNFLLGATNNFNLAFDNNEIQARLNGAGKHTFSELLGRLGLDWKS